MPDMDQRVAELFDQALDLPDAERSELLAQAASGDPEVVAAVRRLLAHDADAPTGFLGGDRTAAMDAPASDPLGVGTHIGGYHVVRSIGSGGMGVIYEAEQTSPRRRVALKVIRPGLVSPEIVRRFRHEAQILGYLQHPGIAQIHEAGTAEMTGQQLPFFVMELVEGQRIDQYARERGLGIARIAELLARVCDAVHHAHQKGVMHRDLKPSNILVSEPGSSAAGSLERSGSFVDAIGQPKVLDFGVARLTDADAQPETLLTRSGQLVGTLAYMSPEQVRGASAEVDTRSDVYSLGVVLFELLTGRLPHDIAGLSLPEAARRICDEEPTRASSINGALRGDLDTILGKALDREPARRYDSALALGEDLRRFAAHEPILARPGTVWYQLGKFAHRNKALVGMAAVASLAVIAALIGLTLQTIEANRQRDEALRATQQVAQVLDFQTTLLNDIELEPLGLRILSDLRAAVLAGASEDERTTRALDWSRLTHEVNPTNLARETINAGILAPATATLEMRAETDPLIQAALRVSLAETCGALGLYAEAYEHLGEACRLYAAQLGEDDPRTLATRRQHDAARNRLGESEEALAGLEETLASQRRVLGPDHLDVGHTLAEIGGVYLDMLEQERAEEALREAYRILDATLEADDPDLIATITRLGTAVRDQPRPDEARELYEDALARLRANGERPLQEALLLNDLGRLASNVGNLPEAAAYRQEAYYKIRALLGDEHPTTLDSLQSIAIGLYNESRYAESTELWEQLVETRTRVLGPEHIHTIISREELASGYLAVGRLDEAIEMTSDLRTELAAVLGRDSHGYISNGITLCDALIKRGRPGEAEPICGETVTLADAFDDGRYGLARPVLILHAQALEQLGRNEEADARYQAAIERYRREVGALHSGSFQAMSIYGEHLERTGRASRAEPLIREFLAEARGQSNRRIVLAGVERLGGNLNAQQRYADAEPLMREAVDLAAELAPGDWRNVRVRAGLAYTLAGMERFDEAIPMLEDCLAELNERIDEIPFMYQGPVIGTTRAQLDEVRQRAAEAGSRAD